MTPRPPTAGMKAEMIQMTGQLGVPVIKIGEDLMVGFDREKIAGKLGIEA